MDSKLFNLRTRLFEESKEIKLLLPRSKEGILLVSMFDTCLIATSQLDAYFSMLGIFETVKKENLTKAAVDFLISWLNEIKKTNDMNLRSLSGIWQPTENNTKSHLEKLKIYFNDLNIQINTELTRLNLLKSTIKK
jgi:hypothetical protein